MGTISNIYLLIFIPLIASLCCQIISGKRTPFYLAAFTSILLFFLTLKIFPDILVYEKISNDFELSVLSLALEFKLDIVSINFLILLIFLKIVILFFFRSDIENSLTDRGIRNFYSVFLLHLFALSGIFTSNNLFNLFLFFEIYAFSFFAISSISNDIKLLKISFNYFCLSVASSLLILFVFFVVYLTFGEVNFDRIIASFNLLPPKNYWFIKSIFWLLALAFLLKFFPLWLYFDKLKSASLIGGFLVIDSLFIKTLIGIFLILKFSYFFFGNSLLFSGFDFDPIIILAAISLIFYSAIRLYMQKHLKLICAYLCLNNLGFIIASIALQTTESLQALFFYLISFSLVNLFIFLFAVFLKRHFHTSSIDKIWLIKKSNFSLILPLKLLIFFIAAFPLTFMFFANWYLAFASMKIGFEIFLFVGLILSNFVQVAIALKFANSLFLSDKTREAPEFILQNYRFYLLSFWFLIAAIYSVAMLSGVLNNFSLRFASYLLSNTI
jgi:multicomponent Na+:H+ antiporter subunit D